MSTNQISSLENHFDSFICIESGIIPKMKVNCNGTIKSLEIDRQYI